MCITRHTVVTPSHVLSTPASRSGTLVSCPDTHHSIHSKIQFYVVTQHRGEVKQFVRTEFAWPPTLHQESYPFFVLGKLFFGFPISFQRKGTAVMSKGVVEPMEENSRMKAPFNFGTYGTIRRQSPDNTTDTANPIQKKAPKATFSSR